MADKGGVILNISSLGGLKPTPGIGIYNISKAALIHMTRQLAIELAPTVRVNALAPGVIKTSFSRALYESDEASTAARQPDGPAGHARRRRRRRAVPRVGRLVVDDRRGHRGGRRRRPYLAFLSAGWGTRTAFPEPPFLDRHSSTDPAAMRPSR